MPTLAETVQGGIIPQLQQGSVLQQPTVGTAGQLIGGSPIQNPTLGLSAALAQGVNPEIAESLRAFTTQDLGNSPGTQAAIAAFQQNTLPLIQQQLTLQGLAGGTAIADVTGRSLATALPSFIQNDLSNRLAANQQMAGLESLNQQGLQASQQGLLQQQGLNQQGQQSGLQGLLAQQGLQQQGQLGAGGLAQGEENLNQSAAALQAQIAGEEANRNLQAQQTSLQSILGFGSNILNPAGQLDQAQLQTAIDAFASGGDLQRGVESEQLGNQQLDFLRQQGLAQDATFGVFGGSVLPPTLNSSGTTTSSPSGGGK